MSHALGWSTIGPHVSPRKVLGLAALPVLYFVTFALANGLAFAAFQVVIPAPPADETRSAAGAFVIVSLADSLVLAHIILRSRWAGWKLSAAVWLVFYGVQTLLSQIETVAFPAVADRLPPGTVPALFVAGAMQAALYAPTAVWLLGRWKPDAAGAEPNERLRIAASAWAWKLAIIAAAYVTLYFTFGYFVAWRNPLVQAYYGGTDPGSFVLQLQNVMRDTPWLPLLQIARALLWVLVALPTIRMMRGPAWETALAAGLAYAVLMNAPLLMPNPAMPAPVAMVHMVETASSNFIFGLIVGSLLLWRPANRDARAGPGAA